MERFEYRGSEDNNKKPVIPSVGRGRYPGSIHEKKNVLSHGRRPPREDEGENSGKSKKRK